MDFDLGLLDGPQPPEGISDDYIANIVWFWFQTTIYTTRRKEGGVYPCEIGHRAHGQIYYILDDIYLLSALIICVVILKSGSTLLEG